MHILIAARLFFAVLIACLVSWYLVPIVSQVAHKLGIIDVPDGAIKRHKEPTPYLGGLAVYIGFIVSLAFVVPFQNSLFLSLVGATILLFVGLIDDIMVLSPGQKFFGQGIAVFCFLKSGLLLKADFFINHMWHIPLSALWILTVVNAFNLVDVMDGLSTTIAIMASLGFIGVALITGNSEIAYFLGALCGALAGFLWYNKPPAAIYLGDAGSLFIGGLLAIVPFTMPWGLHNPYHIVLPMLILWAPLFEITMLITVRTWLGIPFYRASPHHFSLYLQAKGWSKWHILIATCLISITLNVVVIMFMLYRTPLT